VSEASAAERLERLEDLEAIRDLARRYADCVWRRDVEGAVALFAADGVMDTGERPPIRGRAALSSAYREMVAGSSEFLPFVANHVIDLDGDRATGRCYLDLRATIDGERRIGGGHYEDVYVRRADGWRFASRKLVLKFLEPAASATAARS